LGDSPFAVDREGKRTIFLKYGGFRAMTKKSSLKDKTILAVDDEPDVLTLLAEELDMCEFIAKTNYDEAIAYLMAHKPDLAILDIMGVNGFELLKVCTGKRIPAVMLTAHAFTMDTLKASIDMGAKAFYPKEKVRELVPFLEEEITAGHTETWQRLSECLGDLFNATFGADWKKHLIDVGPFIVTK